MKDVKSQKPSLGLKSKFLAYIIGGVIAVSSLLSVNYIYTTQKMLTMELERKGELIARDLALAYHSRYGVITKNKDILNQRLSDVLWEEDVNSAVIYDVNGRILAKKSKRKQNIPVFTYSQIKGMDFNSGSYITYSQSPPMLHVLLPIKTVKIAKTESDWDQEDKLLELGEEYGHEVAPGFIPGQTGGGQTDSIRQQPPALQDEGNIIGYTQINVSLQTLVREKDAVVYSNLLITLLVAGIMVMLSVVFAKRLVKPIKAMSATATEITSGNLKLRVGKYAQDEIGILGDCFNRMVDSLEKRNAELQTEIVERKRAELALQMAHDELEVRVVERTAQLKSANEQLLHAEKLSALGKLAASIAHEFNNPLYGIKMVLEQLTDNANLSEIDLKSVALAIKESDRISRLIRNLQDFYQPSSGEVISLDVHQAIEEVLEMSNKKLKTSGVRVIRNFAEDMPMISAVADQIKQVILNIITNAEEAMTPAGGQLEIQTKAMQNKVQLIFKDTGCGMDGKNIKKIFDPFFTTKKAVKGTGLGLSVSYVIIKKHGGNIFVESEPNKGSTFTIELPV